ncbi:PhlD [Streptomyces sp. NPDC008141]|uniref:PhlD n=1 Tax=Streptomyces sp. NPDC008141 TaxID=3364815 RepID=UPI0036E4CA08
MIQAHVSQPSIALPPHEITMDEICADIERAQPHLPNLKAILRYARHTQVATRRFTRPLSHQAISGPAQISVRNEIAYADAAELGTSAARQALDGAGLSASDVDCVVTSHTTSWTVPGLDVHLIEELGLAPEVRRIPMSTLGCAGGAHALVKAVDHVAAHPDSTVLVVVAEMLSTVYNHHDTTPQAAIYKSLFGDSAAACLVTSSPLGPGLRIDSTWEYTLPRSRDRYRGRLDANGLHFDSEKSAVTAVNDVAPALLAHLQRQQLDQIDFAVLHPGGPRILEDAETALGIDRGLQADDKAKLSRHAWATLRENGNLGGPAVLAVLARTHQDPPAPASRGVLLGVGPGFSAAACTGTWRA